jgi:hypothetical protein
MWPILAVLKHVFAAPLTDFSTVRDEATSFRPIALAE